MVLCKGRAYTDFKRTERIYAISMLLTYKCGRKRRSGGCGVGVGWGVGVTAGVGGREKLHSCLFMHKYITTHYINVRKQEKWSGRVYF